MFEPEGRARHFLEDVDPTFALNVRQGDLLVAAGGLMDFIRAHLKAEAA